MLSDHKVEYLFNEIEGSLNFYEFSRSQTEKMIMYPDLNFDHFNYERLLELQGVTNTILYHLKYKI